MAKRPGEILHIAKDRLQDVVDLIADRIDVGLEYTDREFGTADKRHEKAAKLGDWVMDHAVDWTNKGRNRKNDKE